MEFNNESRCENRSSVGKRSATTHSVANHFNRILQCAVQQDAVHSSRRHTLRTPFVTCYMLNSCLSTVNNITNSMEQSPS
jgi:hypothetical protein